MFAPPLRWVIVTIKGGLRMMHQMQFESHKMTDTYKAYDVLLSFRGDDTRKGFTDHLYTALCRAGYKTFRDEEEIPRTESIRLAIGRAISGSRMAIIVFSENFASSLSCLNEVAVLMECRRCADLIVLPVFYKVEPSEVREQKGRYGEALAQHKLSFTDESMNRWRNALRQAADLGGMVLREGYESQFIGSIVKEVRKQLNYNLSNIAGNINRHNTSIPFWFLLLFIFITVTVRNLESLLDNVRPSKAE